MSSLYSFHYCNQFKFEISAIICYNQFKFEISSQHKAIITANLTAIMALYKFKFV